MNLKSTQFECRTSYSPSSDLYPQFRIEIYEKNTLSKLNCSRIDAKSEVFSESKLSPTIRLLNELAKLQGTPKDQRWPPAKWPSEQAFSDAYDFILNIPLSQISSPIVSLADDGEVNFFWNVDDIYVDLGFYGDGQCSYFAQSKTGKKVYSNAFPTSEGFPSEILNFFLETR